MSRQNTKSKNKKYKTMLKLDTIVYFWKASIDIGLMFSLYIGKINKITISEMYTTYNVIVPIRYDERIMVHEAIPEHLLYTSKYEAFKALDRMVLNQKKQHKIEN